MEELEQNISEIEVYYKRKKRMLILAKLSFCIVALFVVIQSHFYVLRKLKRIQKNDIEFNMAIADVSIFILAFVPALFTPIFAFVSDRAFLKMNWSVKASIFKKVLNQYSNDYHLSFTGQLPDEDIKNLEFEKGIFDFCYGNDLIFGKINHKIFRVSELHKFSLLNKNFNGVVGVINHSEPISESFDLHIKKTLNKYNQLELIKISDNKIYFGTEGKKKYFEFTLAGGKINKQDLLNDFTLFENLVRVMDELSKYKSDYK